jgi:hypothetical protein
METTRKSTVTTVVARARAKKGTRRLLMVER